MTMGSASSIGDDSDRAEGPAWQQLADSLPAPEDPAERQDLLWRELVAQFRWYDRAATRTRLGYQILRLIALVVGAIVTVLAAADAPPVITAGLAAAIVVAEGAQQLLQLHRNWISYRATAETLRQHAFLYAAKVAPYSGPDRREALGIFMHAITTRENTAWADSMRQSPNSPSGGGK